MCMMLLVQEGDVIELCQVSDIRAGGLPKVRQNSADANRLKGLSKNINERFR